MVLSDDTVGRASTMGARAAASFIETGVPSPNPFPREKWPDLADAWRRAYLDAIGKARTAGTDT